MAVTKIKRIRGNPGDPLSYIGNPEKTRNRGFSEADRQALADIIAYAADEKKTEKQYFTTGINCDVENAREQFNITKLSFNKTGGIVCGHCMQSFGRKPMRSEYRCQKNSGATASRSWLPPT